MERAHKYEFEGKVRYSEIDHRATMTLPALINYFQDCSTSVSYTHLDVYKRQPLYSRADGRCKKRCFV